MIRKKIAVAVLCTVLVLAESFSLRAFETDQYNLPDAPLADVGDEVADYAREKIDGAIAKINSEIRERLDCLSENDSAKRGCETREKELARLLELRSAAAIARAVFKPLGGGIPPFTNAGSWMEAHRFRAQPARFKPAFGKSIYRTSPVLYLTISETVKLYGVELGTDKIAHLFQQGYTYYRINERARAKNLPETEAVKKAVDWGKMTERTFYGYWVSGVYSNADLAANFAGMRFYENLTGEIQIDDRRLPPILILKDGFWAFNEARRNLLEPFISDHFNEALNPSHFVGLFGFRANVRRAVKKHACPGWRKNFPNHSAADFEGLSKNLRLWHGEDYGYKAGTDPVWIANTCF